MSRLGRPFGDFILIPVKQKLNVTHFFLFYGEAENGILVMVGAEVRCDTETRGPMGQAYIRTCTPSPLKYDETMLQSKHSQKIAKTYYTLSSGMMSHIVIMV